MSRLFLCLAFTSEIEEMKKFYRDAVGLNPVTDGPFFVQLDGETGGANLGLIAVQPSQKREIELCFETPDVHADVDVLRARGVRFIDELKRQEFGKVIHFRDPDGNLFSLLEPVASVAGSTAASLVAQGSLGRGDSGATTGLAVSAGPMLANAFVNSRDLAASKAFFREKLGLRFKTERPDWIEFETGPTALVLRPLEKIADRERAGVTLGFVVPDVISWSDQARERGVRFTSAPGDEDWGESTDAMDPEGYEVTFFEPSQPPSLEEQLAEKFEDNETPPVIGFRKKVKKVAKALGRVGLPAGVDTAVERTGGRKDAASKKAAAIPKAARAKAKPKPKPKPKLKTKAVSKRPKARPATGRLKKAERRTLGTKKQTVARASKSKPVKRAAAKRVMKKR